MTYTPHDILNTVFEEKLDQDFLLSVMNHVDDYSIGEIPDKNFFKKDGRFWMVSEGYHLNLNITDDEVMTAIANDLYISAFISRKGSAGQVHFLVHRYPKSMKERFEEQITDEVIRYMILRTIVSLRLDTPEKAREYARS